MGECDGIRVSGKLSITRKSIQLTKKIKKENLVALVFAPNNCYAKVVSLDEVTVRIDIEKGIWYHKNIQYSPKNIEIPIGKNRYVGVKEGVIGIYDRTNIDHLDSMIHQAHEATSSRIGPLED